MSSTSFSSKFTWPKTNKIQHRKVSPFSGESCFRFSLKLFTKVPYVCSTRSVTGPRISMLKCQLLSFISFCCLVFPWPLNLETFNLGLSFFFKWFTFFPTYFLIVLYWCWNNCHLWIWIQHFIICHLVLFQTKDTFFWWNEMKPDQLFNWNQHKRRCFLVVWLFTLGSRFCLATNQKENLFFCF